MTLTELQAQIASYMHRDDYDAVTLSGFIQRAMDRIQRRLRAVVAEQLVAPPLYLGEAGLFSLPTDYGQMRTVYWDGPGGTKELKPLSGIEAAKWDDTGSNYALGYRITGEFIKIFPKVSSGVRLAYWAAPAALVNGTDTNYATESYPELALYGALIEAAIWEQNETQRNVYASEFENAMLQANHEAERARYGDAPVTASHYQAPGSVSRTM